MEKTQQLINKLLESNEIALTPYNPSPDKELKSLFEHFNALNKNTIYKSVMDKHNDYEDEQFEFALNTIKHYKGMFDNFDSSIEFDLYRKIKPWLTDDTKKKFRNHFFKEYGIALLNGEISYIDDGLINLIFKNDVNLYIKIAKKLKIADAGRKIFDNHRGSIFNWLNECDDVYSELNKLNEAKFILENMNGKLNASDTTLKYILENTEHNRDLFLSIKRNIGMKKFWEISNHHFNEIFYAEFIETLDDLNFVINTSNISLNTLEIILNLTKEKFPHIYDNLNSLLFVKKGFNNK